MMNIGNGWKVGLILMAAGPLGGCRQDPLTRERFSQVHQNASTQAEVRATIGEPSAVLGDRWIYERPEDHLIVFVDFDQEGRVVRKQWVDGVTGEWHDTKDAAGGSHP